MTIRRRNLRKGLVVVGCLVGSVSSPAAFVGGGLILAGAALHLWSKGCLEQNRRLTTAGPYRFTRNPFYLANLLIDLGLLFVIGRLWIAALFLPIWWISYRSTIAREEVRLSELFPETYDDYRSTVPALFPTGRTWPAERVTGSFSLQNDGLARGAEYARVLGIMIAPAAVWAAELVRQLGPRILNGQYDAELTACLMLPVLWVWKLALAETFRRPETRLVPVFPDGSRRFILVFGLILGSAVLALLAPWVAVVPILALGLVILDGIGEASCRSQGRARSADWRYAPSIATATLVGVVLVASMRWIFT